MNGATAEPEVKTIRLPSRSKHIIIGSIQNFFRSFIKDQSSAKKSPMVTSLSVSSKQLRFFLLARLTAHCSLLTYSVLPSQMGCRTGLSDDAVTVHVGSDLFAHRVLTQQAPDKSDRGYNEVKDNTQNNSRVDPSQDVSQSHPLFMDRG